MFIKERGQNFNDFYFSTDSIKKDVAQSYSEGDYGAYNCACACDCGGSCGKAFTETVSANWETRA